MANSTSNSSCWDILLEFKVKNADDDWELGLLMIDLHQLRLNKFLWGGDRGRREVCLRPIWWFDYFRRQTRAFADYLKRLVQG